MSDRRDYLRWHDAYDDPTSGLAWRLRTVERFIEDALDRAVGPVRIVSSCAGDGRDLLEVLAKREDAQHVSVTLLEIHPVLVERARRSAATVAAAVQVRAIDAGYSDAYVGAVPADLVLMVGIFGNISDEDLERTIATTPQFCLPGATLLWSRGRESNDLNDAVREWFAAAGFTELEYATFDTGGQPAAGAVRYDGPLQPLVAGRRLFTFRR